MMESTEIEKTHYQCIAAFQVETKCGAGNSPTDLANQVLQVFILKMLLVEGGEHHEEAVTKVPY